MIHNPQSWPVVIIIFSHVVCPSVRPSPLYKISQNHFQVRTVVATGWTVSLAKEIIDDTHVFLIHEADHSPGPSDHYFHTECPSVRLSIRPSVHPSIPKLQNQATITAGRDSWLAGWIIDDSRLVILCV